ncbi:MAG TPA: DUF3010 family protein [Bryobacteraceae bacterium]|jgi:hypothetical protein|nr:DUF3010 family protein [Bryobacteraceae bacterium]
MKVVGIEFASSDMNYVILERNNPGKLEMLAANRISLDDTRSCDALRAFQRAVQTLLKDTSPALIAIKEKPEKGAMQAGAAALKMEAIVLADARCDVRFISGARINKCDAPEPPIKAYHRPAFKAAVCGASDQ